LLERKKLLKPTERGQGASYAKEEVTVEEENYDRNIKRVS
jgi:hypothetical protein